jgi:hypothetical protein
MSLMRHSGEGAPIERVQNDKLDCRDRRFAHSFRDDHLGHHPYDAVRVNEIG